MTKIDKKYYINVKEVMELPRPRPRLLIGDGEFLPIVTVVTEK